MEHPEYNRDTNPYPSFGKKYNSERGIISLTSWKARINTVGKTIFSLIKNCPGFHIVLVLSEEEFPKMEKELPKDLMLFVDNKLIELMFVYKNYKSFKKVLFTMDKYRDVPVISADDDCIYTCNYTEELYNIWNKNKNKCISYWSEKLRINGKIFIHTGGQGTLFPPYCFGILGLNKLQISLAEKIKWQDDCYYSVLRNICNINVIRIFDGVAFSNICKQNNDNYSLRFKYNKIGTLKGIKYYYETIQK